MQCSQTVSHLCTQELSTEGVDEAKSDELQERIKELEDEVEESQLAVWFRDYRRRYSASGSTPRITYPSTDAILEAGLGPDWFRNPLENEEDREYKRLQKVSGCLV